MNPARHAVRLLLAPEWASLRAVAPEAAAAKIRRMAKDPATFARGASGLVAAWLARHHAEDGPWVWAVGDAHLGNIALLATGPRREDGSPSLTIDVADVDDEHPAPWSWDLLRLGASYLQAWPDLGRHAGRDLVQRLVEAYADTLGRLAHGDRRAGIIDLNGLPVPVSTDLVDLHREAAERAFWSTHTLRRGTGRRLRRGTVGTDDPEGLTALRQAWDAAGLAEHPWLDGVRRITDHGVSSRGRRRWLVLVADGPRHRVVELKERPASCLARVIGTTPFPPMAGRPLTVPMGGDPLQRVLTLAHGQVLARTRCHARRALDPTACDAGDRARAAHLHGLVLARFHLRGLEALTPTAHSQALQVAQAAQRQAREVAEQARDLARHLDACWRIARDLHPA